MINHRHIEEPRSRNNNNPTEFKADDIFTEQMEVLSSLSELYENPQLQRDARIDLDERYADTVVDVTSGMNHEECSHWRTNKERSLVLLNYARRVVNEVRVHMVQIPGFGEKYAYALENAKFADHATPHSRMLEATQTRLFIVAPQLDDPEGIYTIATAFFPWVHDMMQLLRRVDNESLPIGQRRNARMLHEEEAAIFVKCLTPLIAQSGNMTEDIADKVTSVIAAMVMTHDKPRDFRTMMEAETKAYTVDGQGTIADISDESLLDLFHAHTLDLVSLSSRQWYVLFEKTKLLKEWKAPKHLPKDARSQFGLIPFIEKAFREKIQKAREDNRHPFTSFSREDHKRLVTFTYINVLSDLLDMGYPAVYAITRKLCGAMATYRCLAQPETDAEDALNLPLCDEVRSDWSRAMVEYAMMVQFLKETPFWENDRFRKIMVQTVLVHMVQTDNIFAELMHEASESYLLEEHDPERKNEIQNLVDARIRALSLKALLKHGGIPAKTYAVLEKQIQEGADIDAEIVKLVINTLTGSTPMNKHKQVYAGRYVDQMFRLRDIAKQANTSLLDKPKPQVFDSVTADALKKYGVRTINELPGTERQEALQKQDSWQGFSDRAINKRRQNFEKVFREVCTMAGYADDWRKIYEAIQHNGGNIEHLASQGTTSLGSLDDAATIHSRDVLLQQRDLG
jgi:hypothetical protein